MTKNYYTKRNEFTYDAPPPRFTTAAQERKAKERRSELDGSAAKAARSKVTLPKLNWLSRDKEDDE